MIKLSHDTLESSQDENGNSHRFCIDPFSSKCGTFFQVYNAKRFSYANNKHADPRYDQICVAKCLFSSHGTKQWAMQEIDNSLTAIKGVEIFEKCLKENGPEITFMLPQYASLVSVSTGSKKRQKKEFVVFEDKLQNYTHFINGRGKIAQTSNKRRDKKKEVTRRSSRSQASEHNTSSEHRCRCGSFPDEGLTPTCPPYEDNPPSYEELFENSPCLVNETFRSDERNLNSDSTFGSSLNLPVGFNNQLTYFTDLGNGNNRLCHVSSIFNSEICPDVSHCGVDNSCSGSTSWTDQDEEDDYPYPLLRSFMHHYFSLAKGQRTISNLKGRCEQGERYTLSTPTIHSLTKAYGDRDLGEAGMIAVIENHKCSRWCRHLPSMHEIFRKAQMNAIFALSQHGRNTESSDHIHLQDTSALTPLSVNNYHRVS